MMYSPSLRPSHGLNPQHKIIALWTCFLLGMLFHTQLALMPLFHGLGVTESHTHEYLSLNVVFWLMLGVFGLPLVMIILTSYTDARSYRIFHFGLTLFYCLINFAHLILDIGVKAPGYQLCLMTFLFVIGLLLVLVSYQWIRGSRQLQARVGSVKVMQ